MQHNSNTWNPYSQTRQQRPLPQHESPTQHNNYQTLAQNQRQLPNEAQFQHQFQVIPQPASVPPPQPQQLQQHVPELSTSQFQRPQVIQFQQSRKPVQQYSRQPVHTGLTPAPQSPPLALPTGANENSYEVNPSNSVNNPPTNVNSNNNNNNNNPLSNQPNANYPGTMKELHFVLVNSPGTSNAPLSSHNNVTNDTESDNASGSQGDSPLRKRPILVLESNDKEEVRKRKYLERLAKGKEVRQAEKAARNHLKQLEKLQWQKEAETVDLPDQEIYELTQEEKEELDAKHALMYFDRRRLPLHDVSQLTPYSLLINKIFKLYKKGTGFKFTFNQFVPFWLLYGQLFLRDERFKNSATEYYLLCCKSAQNKRKIARLRATRNKKKATKPTNTNEATDTSKTSGSSSQTTDSNYYGQQLAVPHSPSPPPEPEPEPVSEPQTKANTPSSVEIPAINSGCTARYTLVFNFDESVVYLLKTDDSTHSHTLEFMNDHKVARGFKTQIEMDGNNVAANKLLDKLMHINPVDPNKASKASSSSSNESTLSNGKGALRSSLLTSSRTNKTIGLNPAAIAAMSRAANVVAIQIGPQVSKATLENIVSANKEPQQLLPTSLSNSLGLSKQVHKQSKVRDKPQSNGSADDNNETQTQTQTQKLTQKQKMEDARDNIARAQSLTRYKRLLLPFHMTAGLSNALDEKTKKLVDLSAASDGTITGGFTKEELKSGVSLGAGIGLTSLDLLEIFNCEGVDLESDGDDEEEDEENDKNGDVEDGNSGSSTNGETSKPAKVKDAGLVKITKEEKRALIVVKNLLRRCKNLN
ncbi:unnamed protein product [Ambrosiozyma monospora]|uniref:Unnamed protein product n=1 Tax=Ambrosiozyma monospora TaxID=43982 RepID=A0A9W7DEV8_AMBMO|nr:unnamed protein product [Ambrosiozyma monospora]